MKFLRFEVNGETGLGVLENDTTVRRYEGDMFDAPTPTGHCYSLNQVRLLPPCNPGKMVALWNNSRQQIQELNRDTPSEVLYLLKPSSSFITHGEQIVYPEGESTRVVLEGELGVVIGKKCKGIRADEAKEFIFGYTVINDVTAQDIVKKDPSFPQYARSKGYDTFGVFGPVIETDIDPMLLTMKSFINGKKCQDYPVTDLVFDPYQAVADIARTMTLYPGDVIAMGTTLGVKPIQKGDIVEIRIDGIGSLVNKVA